MNRVPSEYADTGELRLRQWLLVAVVVAVGMALRCVQAFEDRSLWLDEAMLALNVRRLSFPELCGALQYDQAAPVGFLWLQKLALFLVTDRELSARFVPWAAGCLALFLSAKLMLERTGWAALPAMTGMALSPTLICYSGEGKQYSLDVLCTVWALSVGVRWMQCPTRRSAIRAAIFCAVVPWLSHTGLFFLPGVLLLAAAFRKQTGLFLTAVCAMTVVMSVLTLYWMSIRNVYGNTALNNFWQSDYVPWTAIRGGLAEYRTVAVWTIRKWGELVVRSPGIVPEFPPSTTIAWYGVTGVTITVSWLLLRSVLELRKFTSLFIGYTVMPVLACLTAAAFEIYPFGNRLLLFTSPLVFLLLAHAPLAETGSRMRRYQLDVLLSAMVLTWPLVSAWTTVAERRSVANMFAPHYEEDIRPFVVRMEAANPTQTGCYVFHAARPAYEYYSQDGESHVVFGRPGDSDHYQAEVVACLAQKRKWYFLYAHTAPWGMLEPCKAYVYLRTQRATDVAVSGDDVRFFAVDRQGEHPPGSLPTAETATPGVESVRIEGVSQR